jgi:hypothetical protein
MTEVDIIVVSDILQENLKIEQTEIVEITASLEQSIGDNQNQTPTIVVAEVEEKAVDLASETSSQIIEENSEKPSESLSSPSSKTKPTLIRTFSTPIKLSDFELGVTLGTGSFGRVKFAVHKVKTYKESIY